MIRLFFDGILQYCASLVSFYDDKQEVDNIGIYLLGNGWKIGKVIGYDNDRIIEIIKAKSGTQKSLDNPHDTHGNVLSAKEAVAIGASRIPINFREDAIDFLAGLNLTLEERHSGERREISRLDPLLASRPEDSISHYRIRVKDIPIMIDPKTENRLTDTVEGRNLCNKKHLIAQLDYELPKHIQEAAAKEGAGLTTSPYSVFLEKVWLPNLNAWAKAVLAEQQ